jgi:hypothetical protein
VNAVAERDEAHAQRMQMMQERDEAIHLVEAREAARIRTVFMVGRQATDFDCRKMEYQRHINELQLDVHCLNNMKNPILPPAAAVAEDPKVLIIDDDGMGEDAEEPKEERSSLSRMTMVMVCSMLIVIILRHS